MVEAVALAVKALAEWPDADQGNGMAHDEPMKRAAVQTGDG